jgi:hypothetical protein
LLLEAVGRDLETPRIFGEGKSAILRKAVDQNGGLAFPFEESDEVKKYGRPRELVRVKKNGKAISIATGQPVDLDDDSREGIRFKRSLSEETEEDESILRSMARRKRSASAAELAPKRCREPCCDKEFKRTSDLTRHEKTYSRPQESTTASAIGISQHRKRTTQLQREQSTGDKIRIHDSNPFDRYRASNRTSLYDSNLSTATSSIPMPIPNRRSPGLPPLPPPRHLADMPDLAWRWGNSH